MVTARSDTAVREDVIRVLVHDPRIDVDNVDCEVSGGIVYLRGTIPTDYQKRIAAEAAAAVEGVVEVIDLVRVALAQARSDDELAAAIRAALASDRRIDSRGVTVGVADRVARLSGEVGSYLERLRAEEDAWSVPGLIEVIDDISLRPALRRDDRAIADDARSSIAGDMRTVGLDVTVDVKDAVVRLGGSVVTERQKRLVEDKTWPVVGVRKVINELEILPSQRPAPPRAAP